MKTINYYLLKALYGVSILAMFLLAYSCSQETTMDGTENIEAYSVKSDKGAKATRAKSMMTISENLIRNALLAP